MSLFDDAIFALGYLTSDETDSLKGTYKHQYPEDRQSQQYRRSLGNINLGLDDSFYYPSKKIKPRIKKQDGYWIIISPCGNFKEQYISWNQVLRRLGEMK